MAPSNQLDSYSADTVQGSPNRLDSSISISFYRAPQSMLKPFSRGGTLHSDVLTSDTSRPYTITPIESGGHLLLSNPLDFASREGGGGRSTLIGYRAAPNPPIIRSDNGGEYTSNAFEKYLTDLGIDHQTTVPYTSHQNGVAERTNRTIVERTIALMHSEQLPTGLWAEVMDTVVYLKNLSPSRALKRSTPFEALITTKFVPPSSSRMCCLELNHERQKGRQARPACSTLLFPWVLKHSKSLQTLGSHRANGSDIKRCHF